MSNMIFLLKLTENDKRTILMFVLLIVAILSLLIMIALIIEKVGKKQAKRIDILMHDVVVTGVVDSKRKFIHLANKKNNIYFYRHARWSMLILFIWAIATLIFCLTYEGATFAGLFTDYEKYGLATIFPIYDLENPILTDFFGWFQIITGYGDPISTPHFSMDALFAYISIPIFFVGGLMFLFQVQGHLARTIRTYRLASKIYSKNLDNVKYNSLANVKYHDDAIVIEEPKKEDTK